MRTSFVADGDFVDGSGNQALTAQDLLAPDSATVLTLAVSDTTPTARDSLLVYDPDYNNGKPYIIYTKSSKTEYYQRTVSLQTMIYILYIHQIVLWSCLIPPHIHVSDAVNLMLHFIIALFHKPDFPLQCYLCTCLDLGQSQILPNSHMDLAHRFTLSSLSPGSYSHSQAPPCSPESHSSDFSLHSHSCSSTHPHSDSYEHSCASVDHVGLGTLQVVCSRCRVCAYKSLPKIKGV